MQISASENLLDILSVITRPSGIAGDIPSISHDNSCAFIAPAFYLRSRIQIRFNGICLELNCDRASSPALC